VVCANVLAIDRKVARYRSAIRRVYNKNIKVVRVCDSCVRHPPHKLLPIPWTLTASRGESGIQVRGSLPMMALLIIGNPDNARPSPRDERNVRLTQWLCVARTAVEPIDRHISGKPFQVRGRDGCPLLGASGEFNDDDSWSSTSIARPQPERKREPISAIGTS